MSACADSARVVRYTAFLMSARPRHKQTVSWAGFASPLAVIAHGVLIAITLFVPAYAIVTAFRGSAGQPLDIPLSRWATLLANSVGVCAVALLVALPVGTVAGLTLARTNVSGRALWMALLVLAVCIPIYAIMVFVLALLPDVMLNASVWSCGVICGVIYTPLATLIMMLTFRAADRDCEELALLDAGWWTVLRRVSLRQAAWGFVGTILLIALLVGTDITVTDVLAVRTFAEEVYSEFALHRSAAGPLVTSLPVLVVLSVALLAIQHRFRVSAGSAASTVSRPPQVLRLGGWRWAAAGMMAGVLFVIAGVPLGALLRRVGSWHEFAVNAPELVGELWHSAVVAAAAATVCVAFALGLAWRLQRGGWWALPVSAAVLLPLALPAPVVGISLIEILNRPGWLGAIYDSPVVVVICHVVRFLPIAILLMLAAVRRVPGELEAAAKIDGCNWFGVQRHVYWPAAVWDLALAWLVVSILSFGEVASSVLLIPPGWDTAATRAFTLLHFGVYSALAVLAILSIAVIVVPWIGLLLLLRYRMSAAAKTV